MELLEHYRRLLAYEAWANQATLESMHDAVRPSDRALRILMHVFAAERLWWTRIRREDPQVAVWPEPSLPACRDEQAALASQWRDYLATLTVDELARPVRYTNSRGEPWSSTIGDILTHVVLHSAYHRGQIASELRAAGDTPAYTDFIHCVRQGFLD